jgi:cardiolipin synthase
VSTDYVGNLQTPNNTYNKLKEAGVEFSIFNKLTIPFTTGKSNTRNHDKIIVIDNKVAFTGGINIGDDYSHMYDKYGF